MEFQLWNSKFYKFPPLLTQICYNLKKGKKMNETRKLELCKNVFNTFLVAWIGAIAYIFANFETLSVTKIILGVVGEIFISILLFIIARIYVLEER